MAVRKPLVNVAGKIRQLPSGDTLPPQQPAAHTHSISEISGLRSELDSLAGSGGGGGTTYEFALAGLGGF